MRVLGGVLAAVAVAVGVLVAGPVGLASASVTMESSPGGTTTNNTTPSFSGTTTELTAPVTVKIYKGETTSGTQERELTSESPLLSGTWSVTTSPALEEGTYTAIAEQAELVGPPSVSGPVTFTIITAPPTVTLSGPPSLSNNTKPTFSGKASDHTEVVVHIRNAANEQVATATATPGGGSWSTSSESELGGGDYHAYATQESSLGNAEGVSNEVHFTISTASPTVTLSGPPSVSNNTKPTFSGKASDHTEVVVHIRNAANEQVATATATPGGGSWSTSSESELGSGDYHAYATQESSLGNAEGV
ncbi:MAG TPA: Ig-like domain-containing protein, partial [Solirubrobacteraceae bacterium]